MVSCRYEEQYPAFGDSREAKLIKVGRARGAGGRRVFPGGFYTLTQLMDSFLSGLSRLIAITVSELINCRMSYFLGE